MTGKVLSIDPGGTIGWALLRPPHPVTAGTVTNILEILTVIRDQSQDGVVVVCEQVVGSGPRSADLVQTIKQVGAVEYLCQFLDVPVVLQVPSVRKPFVLEARKLLRGSEIHGLRHAVDALAHALAYLASQGEQG